MRSIVVCTFLFACMACDSATVTHRPPGGKIDGGAAGDGVSGDASGDGSGDTYVPGDPGTGDPVGGDDAGDCPGGCTLGFACEQSECRGETGTVCTGGVVCLSNHTCVGGACRLNDGEVCAADLECALACVLGVCGPAGAAGADCGDDEDCSGTLVCIFGECRNDTAGPKIDTIFPPRGSTGQPIIIDGLDFGTTEGTVFVGGRAATVEIWTDRRIVAFVPTDHSAASHAVIVTDPSAASDSAPYEIVPWIASAPSHADPSETILLGGDALGGNPGTATVGGATANVVSWSNVEVSIDIPAGATPGRNDILLTTSDDEAANTVVITVTGNDVWIPDPWPPPDWGRPSVWTGTELLMPFVGWRFHPGSQQFSRMSEPAQGRRQETPMVWAGTEAILWGGNDLSHDPLATGDRYDPITDTWTAIPDTGALSPRTEHTVVWTGDELIVWGGRDDVGLSQGDGGRFDPSTSTWQPVATAGAPTPRYDHTAVWTGTEMLVWGGPNASGGGRYDPRVDRWTPVTTTDEPPLRTGHSAVWTGTEMIIWGGTSNTSEGGRYDPVTDTWSAVSGTDEPQARNGHTVFWTGTEMIVWGGTRDGCANCAINSGGRYDPATDTWVAVDNTNMWALLWYDATAFTGADLVVWGGLNRSPSALENSPFIYDVSNGTWSEPLANPIAMRRDGEGVWSGTELIVWGGYAAGSPASGAITGGRYEPITQTSVATNTTGAPAGRAGHVAVWTGSEMLIWGGANWNSTDSAKNTGGLYDPSGDSWSPTSTTGAPAPRTNHAGVWTGTEFLVWGGRDGSGSMATGGRYDPAGDTWAPMATAGEPSARYGHTAVWTGTEMIVFGGRSGGVGTQLGDGGRYDPANGADGTWSALSSVDAPSPRERHVGAWVGSYMLIYGGYAPPSPTGGARYDPTGDSWEAVPSNGGRVDSEWSWTGDYLVVSGGGPVDRYDPATNTWLGASTVDQPPSRSSHVSVWTGDRVLIWGGMSAASLTNDGGAYLP